MKIEAGTYSQLVHQGMHVPGKMNLLYFATYSNAKMVTLI